MEKTYTVKTPPGDFKVTTSENLLLSQQAVTSKGISVSYTNLQLNSYPNTQLNLFCSDNLSFQCTAPSTWLTNWCTDLNMWLTHQLEKDVGCKVLQFINTMKITKFLGYKTLRCTNTTASSRERWTKANFVSGHNLYEHNFASYLRNLRQPSKKSLYMFRGVREESPNMYIQIGWKLELKIWFS